VLLLLLLLVVVLILIIVKAEGSTGQDLVDQGAGQMKRRMSKVKVFGQFNDPIHENGPHFGSQIGLIVQKATALDGFLGRDEAAARRGGEGGYRPPPTCGGFLRGIDGPSHAGVVRILLFKEEVAAAAKAAGGTPPARSTGPPCGDGSGVVGLGLDGNGVRDNGCFRVLHVLAIFLAIGLDIAG